LVKSNVCVVSVMTSKSAGMPALALRPLMVPGST
jgi:hypothetical protein